MQHLTDVAVLDTDPRPALEAALERSGGLLRLAPCWVPRSFLQPGRRLKLHPDDLYAYGLERGGIDERWFASTTEAANEGRTDDEGLSWIVCDDGRVLLRDAVTELGAALIGTSMWERFGRWPVYSKFFDNMGPIPLHLHQSAEQAALVQREGKPEGYYFPVQHNPVGNRFPHTFFGLAPGTTRTQVRRCIERWHDGDNGILDLSVAHQLRPGTGWIVPPGVLHAPGSLCTYEPQWGSDVFGMYQNLVEGRAVPRELLVKDMPHDRHDDLDFIVDVLDWDANVDPDFKRKHFLEPRAVAGSDAAAGFVDRWIVYGSIGGQQLFSAKELTVMPGSSCTVRDSGAYGLTVVQGRGRANGLDLDCPSLIRFGQLTADEAFVAEPAAQAGIEYECTSAQEPLVILRYFGPDVHDDMPEPG